ncbi:MAG TPA: hypothetical protein VK034_12665 [Enhygromyxa sp.]|nr:hypothetical protein [Enhygromyxa sp.]
MAHLLQKRGRDVLFVADREHRLLFDINGIKAVLMPGRGNPFLSTHDWYDPEVGRQQCNLINQIIDQYRPDALVASQLAMPAFILAEAHSLPLTVIGYCEYLFPGVGEPDSPKQWRLDSMTGHYNNLRASLGLPLVVGDPASTPLIGDKHLLRSVPQLSGRENLPEQVEFVGGLLWEPACVNHDLQRFVERSRQRRRPLFMLQIGRLFDDDQQWEGLVKLLGESPADFVVDLARADYMKDHREFPSNFYLHPFISLNAIKDDVAGVICSGQTTSVLSALHHAKPILGIPNSADGAELTRRLIDHGLGAGIFQHHDSSEAALALFFEEIAGSRFDEALRRYQAYFHEYEQEQRLLDRSFA